MPKAEEKGCHCGDACHCEGADGECHCHDEK